MAKAGLIIPLPGIQDALLVRVKIRGEPNMVVFVLVFLLTKVERVPGTGYQFPFRVFEYQHSRAQRVHHFEKLPYGKLQETQCSVATSSTQDVFGV